LIPAYWPRSGLSPVKQAFQSDEFFKGILQGLVPKLTKLAAIDPAEIEAEYRRVREDGYATCHAEDVDGFGAIACPIEIPDVGVFYSVGITGPLDVVFNGPISERAAPVKATAKRIALALQSNSRAPKAV